MTNASKRFGRHTPNVGAMNHFRMGRFIRGAVYVNVFEHVQ